MGVLSDWAIEERALRYNMINPFAPEMVRPGVISYGVTSYGYDVRLGRCFKIFTNAVAVRPDDPPLIVDPKNFNPKLLLDIEDADFCIIPPNGFCLGESLERFEIPRDIAADVVGKSTYARCGIVIVCTPLEPEWRGIVTIEIANNSSLPAKIYAGEGIAQVRFFRADEPDRPCLRSYADKRGRYQNQKGLTLPTVHS